MRRLARTAAAVAVLLAGPPAAAQTWSGAAATGYWSLGGPAGNWALDVLEKTGLDQTPAADAIRDAMDGPWLRSPFEKQDALRAYSAELGGTDLLKERVRVSVALDEAMMTLAEVAFADDLDEPGRRNKAKYHYERIRAMGLREGDRE